ncbi:MAG: hypothetical protein II278_08520 [Bacteroidaceae bacterium]|nr:hypothetical protein [Bacteroidaceae bacterium]
MKETQADLQAFRLKCYRQMLLEDIQDDYAIQDYQADAQEAQRMVTYLFAELERPNLPIEARADLLLTIFVALQIGYRDPDLFTRAVDMTYDLLPQLAEVAESPEAPIPNSQFDNSCPSSVVRCQTQVRRSQLSTLLVHLFQETQDEELLPYIDHFMSTMSEDAMSEEDRYLIELFQLAEET